MFVSFWENENPVSLQEERHCTLEKAERYRHGELRFFVIDKFLSG